ncbi:hypothetical protein I5P84_00615 [Pseudomonas mosselii]|uniref:hypothetical protein n=1 Tax=Pseudomonas mosselii TaxID=78327 RepID=UPI0018D919B4|nr:hypothetical protein [Pseudomonas mosselii]MBH3307955.1 hypothetical protein [Pseudomonas mosselii]MBH3326555.1 hypothetical protein [Pseudomonas mosselii]
MTRPALLIGLAGGTAEARKTIARSLVRLDLGLVDLLPNASEHCSPHMEGVRARALSAALAESPRRRDPGLIYAHILGEGEAEALRAAGGFVWHLCRPFSRTVAIRHGELLVTDRFGGHGDHLDPEEALSEVLLKRRAG